MVGVLSGMDSEAPTVAPGDISVAPDEAKPDESQPVAENVDNVDEVEHVKELKSILKRRGQYTFRKVKVDFDLIPTKIPYDEDFYTTEIQIVEKEPVKIKSWAAIFAAKKAEAEAEAAAIAEAEEALKKAEEVQKREAAKKANKAKLGKKPEGHPDANQLSTSNLPSKGSEEHSTHESEHSQSDSSATESRPVEQTQHQDTPQTSGTQEQKGEQAKEANHSAPSCTEDKSKPDVYELGENLVKQVLDEAISADLFSQEDIQGTEETNSEHLDEDTSCTDSLAAERSEHLQDTNDDLEEISVLEETSVSQFSEDPIAEESSIQEDSSSQLSQTNSGSETKSTDCVTSVTHSEGSQSMNSDSDSSSKFIELQGKKVPKKVLVSAASLVEEILSEMPQVLLPYPKPDETPKIINDAEKLHNNDVELKIKTAPEADPKRAGGNFESGARRKRREFKKSDSRIYEHVKRSLESAAPEILETAVGVLDEIEKVVIEKVGSRIS